VYQLSASKSTSPAGVVSEVDPGNATAKILSGTVFAMVTAEDAAMPAYAFPNAGRSARYCGFLGAQAISQLVRFPETERVPNGRPDFSGCHYLCFDRR